MIPPHLNFEEPAVMYQDLLTDGSRLRSSNSLTWMNAMSFVDEPKFSAQPVGRFARSDSDTLIAVTSLFDDVPYAFAVTAKEITPFDVADLKMATLVPSLPPK